MVQIMEYNHKTSVLYTLTKRHDSNATQHTKRGQDPSRIPPNKISYIAEDDHPHHDTGKLRV